MNYVSDHVTTIKYRKIGDVHMASCNESSFQSLRQSEHPPGLAQGVNIRERILFRLPTIVRRIDDNRHRRFLDFLRQRYRSQFLFDNPAIIRIR